MEAEEEVSLPRTSLSMGIDRARRQVRMFEALMLYTEGKMTVFEIAEKYECSRTTVLRWARLAGLIKRKEKSAERISDILEAYKDPERPIKEIAEQFNVSQSFVSQQASKAGIARRKFKKK